MRIPDLFTYNPEKKEMEIGGECAFYFHDTVGLPVSMVKEIVNKEWRKMTYEEKVRVVCKVMRKWDRKE